MVNRLPRGPLNPLFSFKVLFISFFMLCVLGSAMGVVYTKHLNRKLHIELQQLQQSRDSLHVEWSKLLLEQGTLGSDVRVEQVAREQLDMVLPKHDEIMVIRP